MPSDRRPRVLYVSYDGALEPLGQSQVVAYLERLTSVADITLLSYEKPADLADRDRVDAMASRLGAARITWLPRRYHRQPPVLSTLFDVLIGCRVARRVRADIVHARGYVPALIGLSVQRAGVARLLFDMRGFWVDEKVEAGHWRRGGLLHRIGKWWERRFLARADAIVSLTEAGIRELPALGATRPGIPIVVIPTCADLDRFVPHADRVSREPVIGYVGTLSNWYLRDETLAYLAWTCRHIPRATVLMVTREDHAQLRADARRAGIPEGRLTLTTASFDEMPQIMQTMDVGVFFIRRCFSKRASAATKLAEFLACSVPVIINDGIGDSGAIVRGNDVGVVLDDASPATFEATAVDFDRVLSDVTIRARCRQTAERLFSLADGVARYASLYEQLAEQVPAR